MSAKYFAALCLGTLFVAVLALATLVCAPWLPDEDEEEEEEERW